MVAPAAESGRSDATLQPPGPGTNWGQNTSSPSFVNLSTTSLSPIELSIQNPSSRHHAPEQAQAQANVALKNDNNSDIRAWYAPSQSTAPGLKHQDGPGSLSILENHAISNLRECSNGGFAQWLAPSNHGPSQSPNPSASEFATAVSSRQVRRRSSGSVHTSGQSSVVNSVKASTPYLSSNTYSVLTATHNFLDPSQTLPRVTPDSAPDLVKPAHTGHKYWCTVCDNHSFEHSDGWKKHEKEHEIKYVCMLEELFEPTKEGGGCNLCGALNQPDNHHLIHNIASCINAARRPCFKRRYDMERHLKDVHAIKEKVLRRNLADKCRCKSSKSAWSCGFCVHLSASHQEHLKHIGTAHFEKGQSLKDWNYNNIIQGLLLQSGISEAWINLLDSLDPYRFSEIKWNKAGGENLLHKLERGLTGNETPQTLAKAAYDSAEFDWSLIDTYITTSATATDMILNQDVGKSLSPSFQDHTSKSEEALVKCQPWSPPPHQAAQIPTSSPNSEVQYAYGTAALRSSPARPLHAFSQSPGWDTLTSDTGDVNSTPRSRYDITPDAAHSDQGTFRYNNNHTIDWPIHHQSDAHNQKIGSTLKRSRDSPSPPYYSFARGDWLTDDPRKKGYLKKGG